MRDVCLMVFKNALPVINTSVYASIVFEFSYLSGLYPYGHCNVSAVAKSRTY